MPPPTITAIASSIRVLLLLENRLLREALLRLFRKHSEILVVGQDGQTGLAPRQLLDRHVHVLIVDTGEFNRLAASIAIGSGGQQTACKTILLGMECDEEEFIAAVRSGVSGFLFQDSSSFVGISSVPAFFRGGA